MRPGICMECGAEYDRVSSTHNVKDCFNNLKTEKNKFGSDSLYWQEQCVKIKDERDALKEENEKLLSNTFGVWNTAKIDALIKERDQAKWWGKQWRSLVESLRRASVRQETAIKIMEQRDQALSELAAYKKLKPPLELLTNAALAELKPLPTQVDLAFKALAELDEEKG